MAEVWSEIQIAKEENRHELILSGTEISEKIEESGVDPFLYKLSNLNLLEISKTCLKVVSNDLSKLTNLSNLILHSNEITEIPAIIGKLNKLKLLDVSRNKLVRLPQEIQDLQSLTTLIAATNQLVSSNIPTFKNNTNLLVLDFSHNKLDTFPDVCHPELSHTSEIKLQDNAIKTLPSTILNLVALKLLDLRDNALTQLPGELAKCSKLKDVELTGNKFSDRRFQKLVENKNKPTCKQITDYIAKNFPLTESEGSNNVGSGKGKGKKGKNQDSQKQQANETCDEIRIMRDNDSTPVITVTDCTKDVRPYIVSCIVHNINMSEASFRHFIHMQTRLHETVCEKRIIATIATHDLSKVTLSGLKYDALPPMDMKIQPLGRNKFMTALELYRQLHKEAEIARKASKRNTYSGIHKYLNLLEGKSLYPCLMNSNGNVISFPPITNCEETKISHESKSILLEVTSSVSLQNCKKVLETLLVEILTLGIGTPVNEEDDTSTKKELLVEQVRVVDSEGKLKVVFPSRTDLQLENSAVVITRADHSFIE